MSGRYTPSSTKDFSPVLRRLVCAVRAECSPADAEALVAFIEAALRKASSNGTVRPRATSERDPAIQALAHAHLQIDTALAVWRRAAASEIAKPDDATSFCAGLALGLVVAGR